MAKKRMFSIDVVETDRFHALSQRAQNLYFHLNMYADDDGVVASPRSVLRLCRLGDAAMNELSAARYVRTLPSGVCAITDWRINNTLRNDRYKPSIYHDELFGPDAKKDLSALAAELDML